MEQQITQFTTGINKDTHPSFLKEGQYFEALNAILNSKLQGTSYTINNEPGFSNIVENFQQLYDDTNFETPLELQIVGLTSINETIIVFGKRRRPTLTEIGPLGIKVPLDAVDFSNEIGILTRESNNTWIYQTVVNDLDESWSQRQAPLAIRPSYWEATNLGLPTTFPNTNIDRLQLLDFNDKYLIQATARLDGRNRTVVYWTDRLNPPRRLVVTEDYIQTPFRELSDQVRLVAISDKPYIQYVEQQDGGSIPAGTYVFAARMLTDEGDPTYFGFVSQPVVVTASNRIDGRYQYEGTPQDDKAPVANKSIVLDLSNLDENFPYFELVAVYYKGIGLNPVARTIGKRNIKASKQRFVWDGTTYDDIELQTIVADPLYYNKAECLLQKDNRLLLGNLEAPAAVNLQKLANKLRLGYTIREIPYEESTSFFDDYKNEENTFYLKGYRRGEVYSFAIRADFFDGSYSFAHHIPGDSLASHDNNELEVYISEEEYPVIPTIDYYTDTNGEVLGGLGIRHHRMPFIEQEPYVTADDEGNTTIRVLGVTILNLEQALEDTFNEALAEGNNDLAVSIQNIKTLTLCRQERDRNLHKSVYAQGCVNRLLQQEGRDINTPIGFSCDYKLGVGDIPIDLIDHLADAVFALFNPFYTIGLTNLKFNARVEPYRIGASAIVDPFYNTTFFANPDDFASDNSDPNTYVSYGGNFNRTPITTSVAFYSPETFFSSNYSIPGNTTLQRVVSAQGALNRISNSRNNNLFFLDGSYNGSSDDPYNGVYRGPAYHLAVDFNRNYVVYEDVLEQPITAIKSVRWNPLVAGDGDLDELNTTVTLVDGKRIKINNYEGDLTTILDLNSNVTFPDNGQITTIYGAKFNILFAPYVPLWLLRIIKDTADYGAPEDAAEPLGVGLRNAVRAATFVSNIVLGLAVAVLELVAIRGAVVNVQEVKDEDNLKKRGTNKYAGRNALLACDGIIQASDNSGNAQAQAAAQQAYLNYNNFVIRNIAPKQERIDEIITAQANYDATVQRFDQDIANLQQDIVQKQLELQNPNLTDAQREQLQFELNQLERQLLDKQEQRANFVNQYNPVNGTAIQEKQDLYEALYGDPNLTDAEAEALKHNPNLIREDFNNDPPNPNTGLPTHVQNSGINYSDSPVIQVFYVNQLYWNYLLLLEQTGEITSRNSCDITRDIYNIVHNNTRQYGRIEDAAYIDVDTLFSDRQIQEKRILRFSRLADDEQDNEVLITTLEQNGVVVYVYARPDEALKPFTYTEGLFSGDTFITKYSFRTCHNHAYRIASIGQNNINRYTLKQMYRGGPTLIVGPVFLPIPNFLAFPGSVFAASLANQEGRIFAFLAGSDPDLNDGIETVDIYTKPVYDPYNPLKQGASLRGGNYVWLESGINCEYRHQPVSYAETQARAAGPDQFTSALTDRVRYGCPYYPKSGWAEVFEYTPELGRSNGYNFAYSLASNLKQTPITVEELQTKFPYRVIYSQSADDVIVFDAINKNERRDRLRYFLPLNFQDVPKHTGYVKNLFEISQALFTQTEDGLWQMFMNQQAAIVSSIGDLITGSGRLFVDPPKEVTNNVRAGCQNKFASVTTPFGQIWYDRKRNVVWKFAGQLEEISALGIRNYLIEEAEYDYNTTDLTVFGETFLDCHTHPEGLGAMAYYDQWTHRYIMCLKPALDKTITLSFNTEASAWVSFHSYFTHFATYVTNMLVSTNGRTLFTHNVSESVRYIGSEYGVYYDQEITLTNTPVLNPTYYPFEISYVINQNPLVTKVFDNITIVGLATNEYDDVKEMVDLFDFISCWNDHQAALDVPLTVYPYDSNTDNELEQLLGPGILLNTSTEIETNTKIYNNQWQITLPLSKLLKDDELGSKYNTEKYINQNVLDNTQQQISVDRSRFKDKYLIVKLSQTQNPANYRRNKYYLNGSQDIITRSLAFTVLSIISNYRINYR